MWLARTIFAISKQCVIDMQLTIVRGRFKLCVIEKRFGLEKLHSTHPRAVRIE